MLNQIVIVGRMVSDPQINETENGRKVTTITLAVPRSYKNENGEYETDFIPCDLWNGIATNTCEYCRKGDLLGIKGRIQSKENKIEIIAEKVTFLSSKPKKETE